jgi:hypothetical protein
VRRALLVLSLLLCAAPAFASGGGDRLRAAHAGMRDSLAASAFGTALHLESREDPEGASGDVYAEVKQAFPLALAALDKPAAWCEILLLHLNTKYCRATADKAPARLDLAIGRKHDQPLEETYRMTLAFSVAERAKDYLRVEMRAESGPLNTRDYRIVLEAVPLEKHETFVHFNYAYGYGMPSRLAAQTYLGTIGSRKVGFTVSGRDAEGRPKYVGGMRGAIERNTMRYYLAIDAYLGALSAPPRERIEKSLRDWFAATERYPRQLREIEQGEYLEMKRREYQRQS